MSFSVEKFLKHLGVTRFLSQDLSNKFEALLRYCNNNRDALYERFNKCPWFVDHGFKHALNVIRNIDGILLGFLVENKDFLSQYEIFCLLAAALLHDIGLSHYPSYLDDMFRHSKCDKTNYYCLQSIIIRKLHGVYSGKLLLNYQFITDPIKEHIIAIRGILGEFADVVAKIAMYHQSSTPLTPSDKERLKDRIREYKSYEVMFPDEPLPEVINISYAASTIPIRARLLAAILRIADACDVRYERAPREIFEQQIVENLRALLGDISQATDLLKGIEDIISDEIRDEIRKIRRLFENALELRNYIDYFMKNRQIVLTEELNEFLDKVLNFLSRNYLEKVGEFMRLKGSLKNSSAGLRFYRILMWLEDLLGRILDRACEKLEKLNLSIIMYGNKLVTKALEMILRSTARARILCYQDEHYLKHQSVSEVYFIRRGNTLYIAFEPRTNANTDLLTLAVKDVVKEKTSTDEVLEKIMDIRPIIIGDEEWKRVGLSTSEDVRTKFRGKILEEGEIKKEKPPIEKPPIEACFTEKDLGYGIREMTFRVKSNTIKIKKIVVRDIFSILKPNRLPSGTRLLGSSLIYEPLKEISPGKVIELGPIRLEGSERIVKVKLEINDEIQIDAKICS